MSDFMKSQEIDPGEPFPHDSNETKLAMMGAKHSYIICKMEDISKRLIDLNIEASKVSTEAGLDARIMIDRLEHMSRVFMTDARKAIGRLSAVIQAEVDADKQETDINISTSPGLEPPTENPDRIMWE